MIASPEEWLSTRRACARAFVEVLGELSGTPTAESQFTARWMERIANTGEISRGGWYVPPPLGASVLAASPPLLKRLGFSSLREPDFFPGDALIDWREGALFAYCSNLAFFGGIPGDFSVTLYFGDDDRIMRHFIDCTAAARAIAALVTSQRESSRDLFVEASAVLSDFGLRNVIQSQSDPAVLDLGHSLEQCPHIFVNDDGTLGEDTCDQVSRSRRFINAATDWDLAGVPAFTLEPQLVSTVDESLPKVTLHFSFVKTDAAWLVDDPTDYILNDEARDLG